MFLACFVVLGFSCLVHARNMGTEGEQPSFPHHANLRGSWGEFVGPIADNSADVFSSDNPDTQAPVQQSAEQTNEEFIGYRSVGGMWGVQGVALTTEDAEPEYLTDTTVGDVPPVIAEIKTEVQGVVIDERWPLSFWVTLFLLIIVSVLFLIIVTTLAIRNKRLSRELAAYELRPNTDQKYVHVHYEEKTLRSDVQHKRSLPQLPGLRVDQSASMPCVLEFDNLSDQGDYARINNQIKQKRDRDDDDDDDDDSYADIDDDGTLSRDRGGGKRKLSIATLNIVNNNLNLKLSPSPASDDVSQPEVGKTSSEVGITSPEVDTVSPEVIASNAALLRPDVIVGPCGDFYAKVTKTRKPRKSKNILGVDEAPLIFDSVSVTTTPDNSQLVHPGEVTVSVTPAHSRENLDSQEVMMVEYNDQ